MSSSFLLIEKETQLAITYIYKIYQPSHTESRVTIGSPPAKRHLKKSEYDQEHREDETQNTNDIKKTK